MTDFKPGNGFPRLMAAIAVAVLALVPTVGPAAAESVELPPAPYKALPEGTKVKYDNWFFAVKGSDGFRTSVQANAQTWFSTHAVFGREGDGVYSVGRRNWASEIDQAGKAALAALWPLKVGNRAVFQVRENWSEPVNRRLWQVSLEVTASEYVTINDMRYPVFVVSERAGPGPNQSGNFAYESVHWYNPDSGLILKSQRKWTDGADAGDDTYQLYGVDYPPGTVSHALKGSKAKRIDATVLAEVERMKREIEEVRETAPISDAALIETKDVDFGAYHALVIGINDYKELPKLATAVSDAKAVAEVLEKNYGFNVKLLLNPTRVEIIDTLDELREQLGNKDNLVIYYAGHGWLDRESDRGYWLPADAQPKRRVHWVSTATITDTLRTLQAKHVMVVADSCYSGTLTRSAKVELKSGEYFRRMANKWTRVALVSGGLEPVADTGGGGHSPFARALIKALRENTEVLDGTELFSRMRRPVMLSAKQTPEYSDIRNAGHDGGDFLFVRSK